MKAATLLIAFLAIFGPALAESNDTQVGEYSKAAREQQRLMVDILNNTIREFLGKYVPYDPFFMNYKEIDLLGLLKGVLRKIYVEGYTKVALTHLSLTGDKTWTLKMAIEAPLFNASIDHWKLEGTYIYGEGHVGILVEKMELKVLLEVNPITHELKSLHLVPYIGIAEMWGSGLYDDPEISEKVSTWIEYFLNEVLNSSKFHNVLSKLVLKILQHFVVVKQES